MTQLLLYWKNHSRKTNSNKGYKKTRHSPLPSKCNLHLVSGFVDFFEFVFHLSSFDPFITNKLHNFIKSSIHFRAIFGAFLGDLVKALVVLSQDFEDEIGFVGGNHILEKKMTVCIFAEFWGKGKKMNYEFSMRNYEQRIRRGVPLARPSGEMWNP